MPETSPQLPDLGSASRVGPWLRRWLLPLTFVGLSLLVLLGLEVADRFELGLPGTGGFSAAEPPTPNDPP